MDVAFCLCTVIFSTACTVVQANGQSNVEGRFSTTHSCKTNEPILIKLDIYNYTLEATRHANVDFGTTTWVVWANSQFATVFFFFFFLFFVRQIWVGRYWENTATYLSNFSLLLTLLLTPWRHLWRHRKSPLLSLLPNKGSKRVVPRNEVPFGGLNDVPLHFGGKTPKKLKFGGVNRTSKPERQKIQILISWKLLSRWRRNFYRTYAPRVRLRGWSRGSPKQIQ